MALVRTELNHPDLVMEEPTRRFHVAGKHMVNRQSGVVSPLLRRRRAPRGRHKVAVLLCPRVDGLTCRDLQLWQLKVVVLSSPAIALSSIIVFGILELVSVTIAFKIKVIIPPSAFCFTTNVFRNKLLSDSRTSLGSPAAITAESKNPLDTVRRGQFCSLCAMGAGGCRSLAPAAGAGSGCSDVSTVSFILSASSSSPCVAAVR